ncbi:biotin transporter BioY [Wolbachia endosymbiont of Pentidionis agamae]|uniref:biotin transporter BioY n=1 Tax=Wolbachia endosymbiont of Pentidionis agamae TaxID=3110435 RepID=UPI002FD34C84
MFIRLHSIPIASRLIEVLFCVLFLFLTSQISIPLHPVPITLQTLGVMIIGLKFSSRTAFYSVFTYILFGIIGVPVFANLSAGYYVLIGPSGGYLIGFLAAATIIGSMKEFLSKQEFKPFLSYFLSSLVGTILIFIFGVSWLAIHVGFKQAIISGVLPFIIPGIVKSILLAATLQYLDCTKK